MRLAFIAAFALFMATSCAQAADKVLMLNEQDQRDFVQVLDAATKAQGLAMAPTALRLYQKLLQAGTVQEQPAPKGNDGHDHETR